jgi:hypothetical protein
MSRRAANPYLITGVYARMGRRFLWTYDKELEVNAQRLLSKTMQEWDPSSCPTFVQVKRLVVSLFGFGADIWDTIEQAECLYIHSVGVDSVGVEDDLNDLILKSSNNESRFYVRWRSHSNTFRVEYFGFLVPPSGDVKAPDNLVMHPSSQA